MRKKSIYRAIVITPEWAGSEVFNLEVVAEDNQDARQQVVSLIGRDFPQGATIQHCFDTEESQ